MTEAKLLAIIPARKGSKGIKNKNIVNFNGKPLIYWTIASAKKSKFINHIVVSTDSTEIASIANQHGIETPFIRPSELADDDSSSIDVILHSLNWLQQNRNLNFTHVALLEPTSPLRSPKDIDDAFTDLLSATKSKSIVSVAPVNAQHSVFQLQLDIQNFIKPIFEQGIQHIRRQDVSPQYFIDGTVYISEVETIKSKRTFYHDMTRAYVVPSWKSIEIDFPEDLVVAQALMHFANDIEDDHV